MRGDGPRPVTREEREMETGGCGAPIALSCVGRPAAREREPPAARCVLLLQSCLQFSSGGLLCS